MKTSKLLLKLAAGLALCWFTGCVIPCLYPLFDTKDFILEPTLAGKWEKMDDGRRTLETLEFTENQENKSYSVLNVDKDGKKAKLFACLGKIDGKEYLCGAIDPESLPEISGWFVWSPRFLIFRVEQIRPELRLIPMDYEACTKLLKEKPEAIAHVNVKEAKDDGEKPEDEKTVGCTLTARTADLQKFIKDYGDKAKLFNPEKPMTFVPPEEAARRDAARQAEEAKAAAAAAAQAAAAKIRKYDLDGDGKLNAEEQKRAVEQEKAEQIRAVERAKNRIQAPPMDE
jgi:hypothetical protein